MLNPQDMMIFLLKFLIQKPQSLMTGMMRKMELGNLLSSITQNTRVHGSQR